MKVLIEIPEEAKQAFDCAENNDMKCSFYDHGGVIGNAIKNAVVIPDNATNLDVFSAIFKGTPDISICPIFCISKDDIKCQCDVDTCACGDWWDAPYKGGK